MAHEFKRVRRVDTTQEYRNYVHDGKLNNKKEKILKHHEINQTYTNQKHYLENKEDFTEEYIIEKDSEMVSECAKTNLKEITQVYDLEENRESIIEGYDNIDHDCKMTAEHNKKKEQILIEERAKEYQGEKGQEYDLEDERKMIEEYIENDVANLYNDITTRQKLLSAEPNQTQWPSLSTQDMPNATSSKLKKALLHPCIQCNVTFETEHILKSHNCIKPCNFKANVRNITGKKPTNVKESDSVITVVDELTITCDDTNKLFKKQLRTKRNVYKIPKKQEANSVRSRNDKGPHICHICNKSLSRRSSLLTHMRRHTGEMPYECDFCDRKFVVQYDLNRHMLTHGSQKKYPFKCVRCRKPFVSKSGLHQHYDQHHKRRKMEVCDICRQYFKTKAQLIKHKVKHEAMLEMSKPTNVQVVIL